MENKVQVVKELLQNSFDGCTVEHQCTNTSEVCKFKVCCDDINIHLLHLSREVMEDNDSASLLHIIDNSDVIEYLKNPSAETKGILITTDGLKAIE